MDTSRRYIGPYMGYAWHDGGAWRRFLQLSVPHILITSLVPHAGSGTGGIDIPFPA